MVQLEKTPLQDCFILNTPTFTDDRGRFSETFNKRDFHKATGLEIDFVQDNQSTSQFGVLRGLHYQRGDKAQAKLVRVIEGEVLDVVVDLRKDSLTYGKQFSMILSAANRKQLFVPKGFAHGFVTLSETSIFAYKCDQYYDKNSEGGIHYADATLEIDWHLPHNRLIISEKDQQLPSFNEVNV
ncbi:MAG: dTDP-4-dehydrorhamnose 3,5-epimerase [Flavobacteriaceae bacterium]|nr:dTDP-4-dehydrorhamnose 3,5-epimerase [Flavobacteriaceae bacterium]